MAADAELVEASFRAKLAVFGDGRLADGLREGIQSPTGARPSLPDPKGKKPSAAATEVVSHVAAVSPLDTDNPRKGFGEPDNQGSGIGRGIDKSLLTISEPRRVRDKAHRKFVSAQVCLVCGRQPSDAHHLRFAQPRALSRKVSDEFTVPLCRIHHREVHRGGDEAAWWNRFGVDPHLIAAALWAQTRPGRSVANHDPSMASPPTTVEPTSIPRSPNGPRNRKTKPIIAAGERVAGVSKAAPEIIEGHDRSDENSGPVENPDIIV